LTFTFVSNDAQGSLQQAQVRVFSNTGGLLLGIIGTLNLRHSTLVADSFPVNGLDRFPSALTATLVLTDRFGNPSQPVKADFSEADPGGATLTGATFNGSGIVVGGSGLTGTLALEVNGVIVATEPNQTTGSVTFAGTEASLNLQSGTNRIRVEQNSLFSNIILITVQ
jgi:hypothetical protein